MVKEWLRLSEVAKELGIHPSTVRLWADQGKLPVHRTQGGHRRFKRAEVELWMESQEGKEPGEADLIVQNALRRTRWQISEGRLEEESWYQKLDLKARDQYRISGRAMMHGMITYLASESDVAEAEARSLGYEYAARSRRYGLSSTEATRAFLFFRNCLLESMLNVFEAAAVRSPYVWGRMFRRVNAFTDQIMLTLIETLNDNPQNK
jgi:excisionase family DNA binding protein